MVVLLPRGSSGSRWGGAASVWSCCCLLLLAAVGWCCLRLELLLLAAARSGGWTPGRRPRVQGRSRRGRCRGGGPGTAGVRRSSRLLWGGAAVGVGGVGSPSGVVLGGVVHLLLGASAWCGARAARLIVLRLQLWRSGWRGVAGAVCISGCCGAGREDAGAAARQRRSVEECGCWWASRSRGERVHARRAKALLRLSSGRRQRRLRAPFLFLKMPSRRGARLSPGPLRGKP